ncbi:hypothetical protein F4677DRAFT_466121 [Hypoxylon crocopeplum]|nr:hypothetical protein F4677DRAFT_466121 [Hypoxylon crocopeplum]
MDIKKHLPPLPSEATASVLNDRASLLSLPEELIREIGIYLNLPKLVDFVCVCRHARSAIETSDMFKKEVEYQLELEMGDRFDHYPIQAWEAVKKLGTWIDKRHRPAFSTPALLWLIENGKSLDHIQQCIDVYRLSFPAGLEGMWYPDASRSIRRGLTYGRSLYDQFPSPMAAAVKAGRQDIIKALVECGVDMRGRDVACLDDDLATDGNIRHMMIYQIIRDDDAFSAACKSQHEDIAHYMISKGLGVRPGDLWSAVEFGCHQVLEELLVHPIFNTDERQEIISEVLRLATLDDIADLTIIGRLLQKTTSPPFDKDRYLFHAALDNLFDKRVPGAFYFFNLYKESATPPLPGGPMLSCSFISDDFLEITKEILSGNGWSLWEPNDEVLGSIERILKEPVKRGCMSTVQYLMSIGVRFSNIELEVAILENRPDMVEAILASGVSASLGDINENDSFRLREMNRPLSIALTKQDWFDWTLYHSAFRLIYHGADFTIVLEDVKLRVRASIGYDESIHEYLLQRTRDVDPTQLSRLSFAQQLPNPDRDIIDSYRGRAAYPGYFAQLRAQDQPLPYANKEKSSSPQYLDQLHAMATLILELSMHL